jgi:hypothetical protein
VTRSHSLIPLLQFSRVVDRSATHCGEIGWPFAQQALLGRVESMLNLNGPQAHLEVRRLLKSECSPPLRQSQDSHRGRQSPTRKVRVSSGVDGNQLSSRTACAIRFRFTKANAISAVDKKTA